MDLTTIAGNARDAVGEFLPEGPTRDFDITLAIAALEGDESAVRARLEAEARRLVVPFDVVHAERRWRAVRDVQPRR
jgi:hypothetical protein